MGVFDSSSSSQSADNSLIDTSINGEDNVQGGSFTVDGALNIGGYGDNKLSFVTSDYGAIEGAFGYAENSREAAFNVVGDAVSDSLSTVERVSGDAFGAVEDVSGDAFGAVEGVSGDAFDAISGVSSDAFGVGEYALGSNASVSKSVMDTLAAGLNSVLSFASTSQVSAIEGVEQITSNQSESFSESLQSLNKTVSTSISQGNTDVIKFVMMGLAAIGVAFFLSR